MDNQNKEIALKVVKLCCKYEKIVAVKNVTIEVENGDCVAVCGLNGSGKSSFFGGLMGAFETRNCQGNIFLSKENITNLSSKERIKMGLSLVPEGRHTFASLTVEENLILGGFIYPYNIAKEKAKEYLEIYPMLKENRAKKAGLLSGGQQQILALVRALMQNPTVFLIDEPTMGLSPAMQIEVIKLISDLNKAQKSDDLPKTILYTCQETPLFLRPANKVLYFKKGEVVFYGDKNQYFPQAL